MKRKVILPVTIFMFIFSVIPIDAHAARVNEQFTVSEGITYKDTRYSDGRTNQAVRVLQVDLNNPYAEVGVGIPSRLNQLQRTTQLAKSYHQPGHQVVGAINASFFYNGSPMNLVSKDSQLVHSGEVFTGKDKYVNEPIAFGIDKNGKGIIDYYNLDMKFIHNGNTYEITSTNQLLDRNKTILYTSYYSSNSVKTNQYFQDIVVTLPSAPKLEFGKPITGTVASIHEKGKAKTVQIPKNGFILSNVQNVSGVKVGDSITLSVDVDAKWKDSSFMLASGPLLVQNGKVSMTIDPKSTNARTRAPRTAVAVDKTGKKVFLVTVDGRQRGYSNGMNLTEFANHLKSLGAYHALNLDGGGSTTMAVRYPGTNSIKLANSPSDGFERAVSTILMAVSTEPERLFSDVSHQNWAIASIKEMYNNGIISGYPDGTFRPNHSITREEAAIMLTKALGLDTNNVTNPGFKDVTPSDKYYRAIAAVANAGIVEGKGNGNFAKSDNLTRAEMAVILAKAYEIPLSNNGTFPDVKESHWGYEYINAIVDANIAGGYPDGTYKPDKNVTRAEFTVFLDRVD